MNALKNDQMSNDDREQGEDRIADLQEALSSLRKAGVVAEHRHCAEYLTLHAMLLELAEHNGISPAEFERHFKIRYRYYHEDLLKMLEEQVPELAVGIDQPHPNSPPTTFSFPRMFPK